MEAENRQSLDELLDLLDITPGGHAAPQDRAGDDPVAQDNLAWLASFRDDMTRLDRDFRSRLPEIDLSADVLDAVADLGPDADLETLALRDDLLAMGEAVRAAVPAVDLVGAVIRTVSGAPEDDKVVSLSARRNQIVRRVSWSLLATAAAATVLFGLAQLVIRPEAGTGTPTVATAPVPAAPTPGESAVEALDRPDPLLPYRAGLDPSIPEDEGFEQIRDIEMDDVMLAVRKDARRGGALNAIRALASLSPADARALLAEGNLSPGAIAAVAAALPPEEREAHLMTAIGKTGRTPALQWALVRSRAETPGKTASALVELETLRSMDGQNALSWYTEARALLNQGDLDGALALLRQAATLANANAYALEMARFEAEALGTAGASGDAAAVLAALTAGDNQYIFLCDLGDDLLKYGQYYAELGDDATAGAIYEAVFRLGQQLNDGGQTLAEQIAALDIQRAALETMRVGQDAAGAAQELDILAARTMEFLGEMESLGGLVQMIEGFLATTTDPGMWTSLADWLLAEGSSALGQAIGQAGTGLSQLLGAGTGS